MGIRSSIAHLLKVFRNREQLVDRSTRFALTIVSFLVLTVLMIASFTIAVLSSSDVRFAVLIELVTHLSFVLGGCVGAYLGLASIWPGQGGFFSQTTTTAFLKKKVGQEGLAPNEGDAQVD
jgi:membrane protein YqaA with SNARE-associated domain